MLWLCMRVGWGPAFDNLSHKDEIEISQRIEAGRKKLLSGLFRCVANADRVLQGWYADISSGAVPAREIVELVSVNEDDNGSETSQRSGQR